MTTTTDTRAEQSADATRAVARIDAVINSLRGLAALAIEQPAVANAVVDDLLPERLTRILVYVSKYNTGGADIPEYIATLATAAAEHGATLKQHRSDKFAGIDAHFGLVNLHVYADIDEVGQVSRRTERVTVTDFQPHPAIAKLGGGAK